jgi:hypothetical protein
MDAIRLLTRKIADFLAVVEWLASEIVQLKCMIIIEIGPFFQLFFNQSNLLVKFMA